MIMESDINENSEIESVIIHKDQPNGEFQEPHYQEQSEIESVVY